MIHITHYLLIMKLNQTPKTTVRSKPRIGRGYGSGHGGHTSTRGQKGQRSRGGITMIFEGGQLPLTKRIPWLRGKQRFQSLNVDPTPVNLDQLNQLPTNTIVTKELLHQQGFISSKEAAAGRVKILGRGQLDKAITISGISVSSLALKKIKAAGGSTT